MVLARQEASALLTAQPGLDGEPLLRALVAQWLGDERSEFLEKV